ncbi:hypothetical protein L596_001183 [Steinernema carpocapsae]|uniref:Uncharacterized protein n=1 Tax=Steinernema carpocapsae TaxID=34508 RepID=A0A4V6I722_STECR|nr:hypothetical protein L596_001183 [Steinernema carpocapsae]
MKSWTSIPLLVLLGISATFGEIGQGAKVELKRSPIGSGTSVGGIGSEAAPNSKGNGSGIGEGVNVEQGIGHGARVSRQIGSGAGFGSGGALMAESVPGFSLAGEAVEVELDLVSVQETADGVVAEEASAVEFNLEMVDGVAAEASAVEFNLETVAGAELAAASTAEMAAGAVLAVAEAVETEAGVAEALANGTVPAKASFLPAQAAQLGETARGDSDREDARILMEAGTLD